MTQSDNCSEDDADKAMLTSSDDDIKEVEAKVVKPTMLQERPRPVTPV
jgi:hypothetical protein